MSESILRSIRNRFPVMYDDDAEAGNPFDDDLIFHINATLMILTQNGVGPADGFRIESEDETWEDFIGNTKLLEAVKEYVYLKVRLLFDPPTSGILMNAMTSLAAEMEWRVKEMVEKVEEENA